MVTGEIRTMKGISISAMVVVEQIWYEQDFDDKESWERFREDMTMKSNAALDTLVSNIPDDMDDEAYYQIKEHNRVTVREIENEDEWRWDE
jgi:hypothetical protein